jgi:hypothetical protein
MPATQILTQAVQGPYPTIPVAATSLDLTFTNYFVADAVTANLPSGTVGGDELIVHNPTAGALTITFTSQPLNGRSGDITSYSVGAGVHSAFKYSQLQGWVDANGNVNFTAQAGLVVAVLRR